jgi:hypothetical protein
LNEIKSAHFFFRQPGPIFELASTGKTEVRARLA